MLILIFFFYARLGNICSVAVGTHFSVAKMAIQVIHHNTTLVPDEDFIEKAENSGAFEAKWSIDDQHVKLYPKQLSGVKVQILRESANVWLQDLDQLSDIEDLLDRTFRIRGKRKPFKQPKIQLQPGEQRKNLETPLGLISIYVCYYRHDIAEAVYHILQHMSTRDKSLME